MTSSCDTKGSIFGPTAIDRWADFLLVIGVGIIVALQVMWLGEPWDKSHAGFSSGAFCGYSLRGFERHGYFEVGGIPSTIHHAAGGDLYQPYVNHPPTLYLHLYPIFLMFGQDETAIHLAMLSVLLLTMLSSRIFLAFIYGRRVAAFATLIFSSLPIAVHYMRMADPVVYCLPFLIPTAYFWMRYSQSRKKSDFYAYFGAGYIAGMMDWQIYFLVVALWLDVAFCRQRRWKDFGLVALPFLLSLISVLSWVALSSVTTLQTIQDFLAMTKTSVTGGLEIFGPSAIPNSEEVVKYWFIAFGEHFRQVITIPILVVALLASLILVKERRSRSTAFRFTVVLLVTGLLPFLAAHEHAFVHEFWPIMVAPALTILGAFFFVRMIGSAVVMTLRVWGVFVLLGTLVGFTFISAINYHDSMRTVHPRNEFLELSRRLEPTDLVFSASVHTPQKFYAEFTVWSNVFHPELYKKAILATSKAQDQFTHLYIFWPEDAKFDYQWLAKGDYPIKYVFRERFDGVEAALIELDIERAFAQLAGQ